jgi:hypothetical protein
MTQPRVIRPNIIMAMPLGVFDIDRSGKIIVILGGGFCPNDLLLDIGLAITNPPSGTADKRLYLYTFLVP